MFRSRQMRVLAQGFEELEVRQRCEKERTRGSSNTREIQTIIPRWVRLGLWRDNETVRNNRALSNYIQATFAPDFGLATDAFLDRPPLEPDGLAVSANGPKLGAEAGATFRARQDLTLRAAGRQCQNTCGRPSRIGPNKQLF